jgi:hypothetical protein
MHDDVAAMGGGSNVIGYAPRHTLVRYKTWLGGTVAVLFDTVMVLFTSASYLHRRFVLRHW